MIHASINLGYTELRFCGWLTCVRELCKGRKSQVVLYTVQLRITPIKWS